LTVQRDLNREPWPGPIYSVALNNEDTLVSPTQQDSANRRFIGVRVLAHPDAGRVGDFATLFDGVAGEERGRVSISRAELEFRAPDGRLTGALESRRISRTPLQLSRQGAGLRLHLPPKPAVEVNGVPLQGDCIVGPSELEVGVVVLFGKDLALCIGWMEIPDQVRSVPGLLGESAAIQRLREQIHQVASVDVPVLLRGATGVGKELVAAAIHKLGPRSRRAYVAVNVAGFPATMAASELFGHARGAFTGAIEARDGYFAQAEGGSLFLDEIGDVSFDVQALLLRAIQEGVIQPLGGKLRQVDVRLIAATDSDLESAVARREFREPLLRRFSYAIHIPPLRARREDVGILFYRFLRDRLKSMGDSERLSSVDGEPFVPAAYVARLALYEWPGNVRELANVAVKLAIENRGRARAVISEEQWATIRQRPGGADSEALREGLPQPGATRSGVDQETATETKLSLSDHEIMSALELEDFRRERAARRLGVSKSFLYRRLIGTVMAPKADDIPVADLQAVLDACEGDVGAAAKRLRISSRALRLQFNRLKRSAP
jgi:two-component system nitrogen regulation response regulator GlnG